MDRHLTPADASQETTKNPWIKPELEANAIFDIPATCQPITELLEVRREAIELEAGYGGGEIPLDGWL